VKELLWTISNLRILYVLNGQISQNKISIIIINLNNKIVRYIMKLKNKWEINFDYEFKV
jgi:hypothetical protein